MKAKTHQNVAMQVWTRRNEVEWDTASASSVWILFLSMTQTIINEMVKYAQVLEGRRKRWREINKTE